MSSTSNVQNFLVNVFRPVYTYDPTTTTFTPKLELSNIDTYSGNTISIFTAAVGDSNNNVYVGSNAGNSYTTTKLSRNVTAVGYAAGSNISNVSNSVFLGYNAGAGAASVSNNVAIGDNASGNGSSNVRIGSSNLGTGNGNVSIGAGTSSSTYSNTVLLGPGITATQDSQFKVGTSYLTGNSSTKWLGIGTTTPYDANNKLDVSGNLYVFGQQGINMVPIRTLDVNGNFRASDAFGTLDFSNGVTSSSNGFASRSGTLSNAGVGSTTPIGTLKKGAIVISAQDVSSIVDYASSMIYCFDPTDGMTGASLLSSAVQAGDVSLTFSTSNIQISNATAVRTISWSVTYFPLP
jgi:hypothetical protein